jgi:heme exporter protein A
VFSGVSFALERGEALLLKGPNGSGKTSLLRVVAGLLPTTGDNLKNGFATAFLAAEVALKPANLLIDELSFWARLDGRGDRVTDALERFDLRPLAGVPCRMLSAGQRRRAGLARLWAQDADLWLLDEPSLGLDDASVARLAKACADHLANGGAIIAATHVDFGLSAPELQLSAREMHASAREMHAE